MTLVRSEPFGDVDRLFGRYSPEGFSRSLGIPLDAYRRADHFVVEFDLPGVRAEDTNITVESNTLTVTATRRPRERGEVESIITERRYGTFTRQLVLADTLDTSRIEADFSDGVLTITIPVADRAKPRRIDIRHEKRASPELATTSV